MSENSLPIINSEPNEPRRRFSRHRAAASQEDRAETARAHFERLWLQTPEIFDPNRSAIERMRLERSWNTITPLFNGDMRAADLGFGWGGLTRRLQAATVQVDALDVASQALQHFEREGSLAGVRLIREALPQTSLQDGHYDLVLCCDVIAELQPNDQRLLISELYRLVKPDGYVIFTTPLDIDSDGALEQLAALVETELMPEHWVLSHHCTYLKLLRLLHVPENYLKGRRDPAYRSRQLAKRGKLGAYWFKLNCSQPLTAFWWCLNQVFSPAAHWLEQSSTVLQLLEKFCRTFKPQDGVSHAILVAKRKNLQETAEIAESTMSRSTQRLRERVWE
jgi:2-polyprenyl-3-methyl-5-hydroxy-6-metoxy-1,4-benzoquinol methylase